jgi:hypothetical protein
LPPSPEDDPDALPAVPEISSLNDCAFEFQDLVVAYQQAKGCVDVVPAYKAFEAMRHNFPLARIVDDLDKRRNCDQWQRGRIPKLSNYLADRVWLNPIPAARASPPGPQPRTIRDKRQTESEQTAKRLKAEMGISDAGNNAATGQVGHGFVQYAALPGGAEKP